MSTIDPTDGFTDAERAEFDRQEAEFNRQESTTGTLPADETKVTDVGETKTREQADAENELPPSLAPKTADEGALREVFPIDVEGHAKYPVEKARAFAADALVPTQVYSTPWGNRAMTDHEVADLRAQGLEIKRVDAPTTDSLQQDKDAMSGIQFGSKPDQD